MAKAITRPFRRSLAWMLLIVLALGGALGAAAAFGAKLRAHKVTSAGLDDYVTTVVTAYLDHRHEDESFARWVLRADEALLRGGTDRGGRDE